MHTHQNTIVVSPHTHTTTLLTISSVTSAEGLRERLERSLSGTNVLHNTRQQSETRLASGVNAKKNAYELCIDCWPPCARMCALRFFNASICDCDGTAPLPAPPCPASIVPTSASAVASSSGVVVFGSSGAASSSAIMSSSTIASVDSGAGTKKLVCSRN